MLTAFLNSVHSVGQNNKVEFVNELQYCSAVRDLRKLAGQLTGGPAIQPAIQLALSWRMTRKGGLEGRRLNISRVSVLLLLSLFLCVMARRRCRLSISTASQNNQWQRPQLRAGFSIRFRLGSESTRRSGLPARRSPCNQLPGRHCSTPSCSPLLSLVAL